MRHKIFLIIAAVILIVVLCVLTPSWFTPTSEKKISLVSTPLESYQVANNSQNSLPFMPAQPLQYAMPHFSMDMLIPDSEGEYVEDISYKVKVFLNEFKELGTATPEFNSIIAQVTTNGFSYTYKTSGQLPPVVYNPSNPSQQSPR